MSSERPNQTLADYVVLVVSPALLMGLIGSLVFFLLEICYPRQGEYKDRLQYILFFFVFGAVLVGRISMTAGIAGRAGLYGLALAAATWAGMQIYVEYPKEGAAASFSWLINLFLVGVVWWCSRRLTWDCTQIDEETEVGGEGLLQATGLEKPAAAPPPADESADGSEKKEPEGFIGWWERYERYREGRKNRRVLGASVVYFSLAALPLFGLGEALIPVEETARRQYAFWLTALYVGCGLGLLLTTCFLSVRRYLRQRRLRMPAAMTAAWLAVGGGLAAALLAAGALLPRPRPEYTLLSYPSGGAEKRSASDFAGQGGSSGQGDGNRIGDRPKDQGNAADKDSPASGRDRGETARDKDQGGAAKDRDQDGAGRDKDKESADKAEAKPTPRDEPAGRPKDRPPSSEPARASELPKDARASSSWDWRSAVSALAAVLKWIVFALVALAVVFFLVREGLKFLANFTDWARSLLNALQNLWANLLKGRGREAEEDGTAASAASQGTPPKPFAAYENPFAGGRGGRRPIKDAVAYTFAALQAWAREHNAERRPGETPLEFASRLGEEYPALEADVLRFAALYARSVYDYAPLPADAADLVRRFWERLEAAADQPMSA